MQFHNMFATHLEPNMQTGNPERVPTRNGYGDGLVEAGNRDEHVVALSADLTESTRTYRLPKRFRSGLSRWGWLNKIWLLWLPV